MKLYLKCCIFIIVSFALPCFSYTEDVKLQECMKEKDYTTSAMMECCYKREKFYKQEGQRLLKLLKNQNSSSKYQIILNNQNLLEKYCETLQDGAANILFSYSGTMYQTMASGILYDIYRENSWVLEMILSNKICPNELNNSMSYKELENTVKKLMQNLKENLSKEAYNSVLTSQTAWVNYLYDTKHNLFKILPQNSNVQAYIVRLLYENRISVLSTINTPFE